MALAARKIEWETTTMDDRTALEEKVENIANDVTELKSDVKRIDHSLNDHRVETQRSFGEVRQSISDLRGELKQDIADVRGEIKHEVGTLRGEIADLRGEIRQTAGEIRLEMQSLRIEMRDGFENRRKERSAWILSIVAICIAAVSAAASVVNVIALQMRQPQAKADIQGDNSVLIPHAAVLVPRASR